MTITIDAIEKFHSDWIEADVFIEETDNFWAVKSNSGGWKYNIADRGPCVIHSALDTREAAEVARWDALLGLNEPRHCSPYGPSEVPLSFYNTAGRVLRTLRWAGVASENIIGLAVNITHAAETPFVFDDDDGESIEF